jgi:hypothetical protein
MQINLNQQFFNLKGVAILIEGGDPLTLREAAAHAIASVATGAPDKSLQRLKLARRIHAATSEEAFEVTTEEASEIKQVIAQVYNALIAGQAVEMIEGAASAKTDEHAVAVASH